MSGAWQEISLSPGLHLVATPIGRARDVTLSALDALAAADVLAAEDTRTLRRLMEIHGVPLRDRHVISYHDMNGAKVRPKIMRYLADGRSVAYASDAGTPLVADPGFVLVRDALEAGHVVTGVPGPVAAIHALTLSGLPTDRFAFAGFLPHSGGARRRMLSELRGFSGTVVFYDSPKRCSSNIREIAKEWGGTRQAAVCRELTKRFEEILRGSLDDLANQLGDRVLKGEIVICVGRADATAEMNAETVDKMLTDALERMSVKDAVADIVARTGRPRREVYQAALRLSDGGRS